MHASLTCQISHFSTAIAAGASSDAEAFTDVGAAFIDAKVDVSYSAVNTFVLKLFL